MSFFQIRSPLFSNRPFPSQDFVLTVSGPELIAYQRQLDLNRYTPTINGPVEQFSGATVQQTYLFPPNQPEMRRYNFTDINRAWLWEGPEQQVDGSTRQQTYIFPPNQPELNAFTSKANLNRYNVEVTKQVNQGAILQAWYIYPVNQPQFKYYLPDINRFLATDGMGPQRQNTGATIQQTYVFSSTQPELRYNFPDLNRYLNEGSGQILDQTIVPVVVQTYIFGVYQPDNNRMYLVRSQNGAFTVLDSVVVPSTSKQYYTGQFHTTKALLRRGIGF